MQPKRGNATTLDKPSSADRSLLKSKLTRVGPTVLELFSNMSRAPRVERELRHTARDLMSMRVVIPPENGEGYWDVTRIGHDIFVTVANFSYKDPHVELMTGDGLIQFGVNISGDQTFAVSRTESLRLNRPSLLLWAQPAGIDIRALMEPRARERYITVSVRPKFLSEHFLTSSDAAPEVLREFTSKQAKKLSYYQRPLDSQTFELALRLINNPHSGALALIYTEGLALELLCSAIASLSSVSRGPSEAYTERELNALYAARNILMKQLSPAPTIAQLARTVGMAQSALTKGFKTIFDETVFDFSIRCRMRQALTLMRDSHSSVARASEAVGYAQPTSFATAFQRHFGIRPIDVRRIKAR